MVMLLCAHSRSTRSCTRGLTQHTNQTSNNIWRSSCDCSRITVLLLKRVCLTVYSFNPEYVRPTVGPVLLKRQPTKYRVPARGVECSGETPSKTTGCDIARYSEQPSVSVSTHLPSLQASEQLVKQYYLKMYRVIWRSIGQVFLKHSKAGGVEHTFFHHKKVHPQA